MSNLPTLAIYLTALVTEMPVVLDPDLLWGIHEPSPLVAFLIDTWSATISAMRVIASVQVRSLLPVFCLDT